MYTNRSRGFTLIELLVVIAIIGILSAVVLASLNTARNKGSDAAEASSLTTIQTQAEIYYGANNNTYGTTGIAVSTCGAGTGTLFADTTIQNAIKSAESANGGGAAVTLCAVDSDGTSYAMSIQSKVDPTKFYCIDNTGFTSPAGGGTTKATGGGTATLAKCG